MREIIMYKNDGHSRRKLAPMQVEVLLKNGTEPPFSSEFVEFDEEGIYVNAATGEPLFSSYDKFYSSCGWPSFSAPIKKESVRYVKDLSHGMVRTEVRSGDKKHHLGHVFEDGPKEMGGQRYCINGAALRFVPTVKMEQEGYGELLSYIEKQRCAR